MMKIALQLVSVLLVSILVWVVFYKRQVKYKHPIPFTVDRHTSVTFTDSSATAVINAGVKILKDVDISPKNDVSTNLPLVLSGSVGTFSHGDGTISTPDDLKAIFEIKKDVHVVSEIGCCGGEKNGIIGCSGPGKPIIVTAQNALQASAVLWMHELGHNKGLCHRDHRSAIMHPILIDTNNTVNQYEHDVFEGAILPKPCPQENIRLTRLSVIEFVHQIFIEGVPYAQGSQYTADDIHTLKELLDKSDEQRSWLNAITVLGMIGDRQAWIPIKRAFERDAGELSQEKYAAKLAVPLALGYLLAKGYDQHDQEILEYLSTGLMDPRQWSKRVSWLESRDQSDQVRNARLARLAIVGMGISGRPEALTALETLYDQLLAMQAANLHGASLAETGEAPTSNRAAGLSEYEPGTLSVLKAAIQTNKRVHQDGLVKYYRDSELEQLGFNL